MPLRKMRQRAGAQPRAPGAVASGALDFGGALLPGDWGRRVWLVEAEGPFQLSTFGCCCVFFGGVFLSEQREQVALAEGLEANVVALCRWVYYG